MVSIWGLLPGTHPDKRPTEGRYPTNHQNNQGMLDKSKYNGEKQPEDDNKGSDTENDICDDIKDFAC
jgi:hypothetical protein